MKRSKGVTILGWFIIISTIVYWFLFYRLFAKQLYLLLNNILYSALFLIAGIGILKLKPWARITFLCMIAIQTVAVCYRGINYMFKSGIKRTVGIVDVVSILIMAIFVFWFLNRKSIKEQFRSRSSNRK